MALKHRLQHTFRAMRHGEFVVYWAGQATSVIGTWMQSTALSWLVYRITSSPVALGVMALARFGPSLLGAPFAGLVVDRFPRRKVVILTQATSLTLAIPLTYLTLTNQVQLWQLLVLAMAQGCVDTLDMTARQTFQMDIVGPEDVQSAVALNSAAFNSARMVGPVLAGVIVHFWSEGICFAINAISYLAVLISLFTIQGRPHVVSTTLGPVLREIRTGLSFVWHTPSIRVRMLAMGVTSTLGLSIQTLLPVFVVSQLHGDAQSFGMLGSGMGIGAILGALTAASASGRIFHRAHAQSLVVLGLGLTALSLTHTLHLAVTWMAILGLAVSIQMASTNNFIQTSSPEHLRGRVLSIYIWVFSGFAPIGGLIAGWAMRHSGPKATIFATGALCCLSGILFLCGKVHPPVSPSASESGPSRASC